MVDLVRQNFRKNTQKFKKTKKELKLILGDDLPIDHVGSTVLPHMIGKNILDVLVGVSKKEQLDVVAKKLEQKGFFRGRSCEEKYRFLRSSASETKNGDTHIHVAIIGDSRYEDFLILKRYLLDNPNQAQAYAEHKKLVVEMAKGDRKSYRAIKGKFVDELLVRAREYAEGKE